MALAYHVSRGRRTYNAHCFAVFSTNAHAQRLSSGREPCRLCVIGTHSSRCTTHHVSRERRTCNAHCFAGTQYARPNSAAFVRIMAQRVTRSERTAWRLRVIGTHSNACTWSFGNRDGTHSSRCTTHHVSRRTYNAHCFAGTQYARPNSAAFVRIMAQQLHGLCVSSCFRIDVPALHPDGVNSNACT